MFLVGTLTGVIALIAGYPVYGGLALRYAAAAVILLAVASARRLPPARLTPRDVILLAVLAAVGMVGFNVCVIEATRAASPAMVGTVVGAVPVALAIAGPLLTGPAGRRHPSARVAAAGGVIVAGAALTTGLGTGSLRGLLFASGALACEAGFSLLAMPLLPKLGPIRVSGYAAAAAVPMALAAAAIADGPGMLRVPTTAEAAGLAYLAVVVSASGVPSVGNTDGAPHSKPALGEVEPVAGSPADPVVGNPADVARHVRGWTGRSGRYPAVADCPHARSDHRCPTASDPAITARLRRS